MIKIGDVSVLTLLLSLFIVTPAMAQEVKVRADVDRPTVGLGQAVNVTVTIEAKDSVNVVVNERAFDNVPGFELVNSSSGYETRSAFVNGRFITEQARTFTYQLVARKKGELKIPPLDVSVNDRNYRTEALKVTVNESKGGAGGNVARGGRQAQPDPFDQMDDMEELFQQMLQRRLRPGMPGGGGDEAVNPNDSFFIQAEVDKRKAFVGEQITTNFYLVTRGQIRDIDTLKYPDLKGFWKEDLEMATRLNFENVTVNGTVFQRALLVSYALFPIKPGKTTVDAYKAKCTVLTPSSFGFGRPIQLTKASTPITIDVADVPANKPANYTGAVGNFAIKAQFEPPTGTVGQPVTLRVRLEGTGNAKLIELPKLNLPPSFELYDQKSQAKFMKDGTSFKEFEVLIIPREPGVFKIPAVTVATFDPKADKFTEISSQPLDLSVTGTAAPAQAGTAPPPGDKGPSVSAQPNEPKLPPLATEMGGGTINRALPLVITLALYTLSLGFLALYGFRRLRHKPKKQSLHLVLKRRLGLVREFVTKKEYRRVGVELTNTAYAILGQLTENGGANQELERLLEQTPPSLRNELAQPIQKLLSQCEALSFAPESLIADMTEKSRLDGLIADFEKVMNRAIELAEI